MTDKKNDALPGIQIPEKMFFKIRDVAEIVDVKPHVLRYWESEFPTLHPKKNRNGQRIYTKADIEHALEIKRLLHVERYSIAGARQKMKKGKSSSTQKGVIPETINELTEIMEILDKEP